MKFINRHSEWMVFLLGLILMASMNPYTNGASLCLLDVLGFAYCPGEGLGHSIAFLFRGEIKLALDANLMGPLVVVGLSVRILTIWKDLLKKQTVDLQEKYHV
ncbi:MAG: DUF2752 domain-containing protein [Balneola sp.]